MSQLGLKLQIPAAIGIVAALTSIYEWAVFASTFNHPGSIGINYNAPGTDWMVFYEAIQDFRSGTLGTLFDGSHFTALINAHQHGWLTTPLPFRPWVYPPSFLLLVMPIGLTSFLISYVVFQIATALVLAWVVARCCAIPWNRTALVLLSPAAAICVTSGQTTFLVAALMLAGLYFADRKTVLSGLLLSILTFKPQFFLLVPIALIAGRNWRALGATALFSLLFTASSAALFGIGLWTWWIKQMFASLVSADPRWVEYGRLWGNSIYACTRALGLSGQFASVLQIIAIFGGIVWVYATFRSSMDSNCKLASFLTLAFLVAPHSGSYDGVLLVIPIFVWISQYQIQSASLMPWIPALLLWMMPLFSPPVLTRVGAVAPFLILVFLGQLFLTFRTTRTI